MRGTARYSIPPRYGSRPWGIVKAVFGLYPPVWAAYDWSDFLNHAGAAAGQPGAIGLLIVGPALFVEGLAQLFKRRS